MSEALTLPGDERGLSELIGCVQRIVASVHVAPLSRDELMKRWGLTEVKTFNRWCERSNLRPFEGRGEHARYRMNAVLRAEQRGEKLNGGEGL